MITTKCHSEPIGIGIYEPEKIVKSTELMEQFDYKRFGIEKRWIDRVIGIEERRFSDPNQRPSDMATLAAKKALDHAQLKPEEIDFICFASISKDYFEPASSHVVQHHLGAKNATCLDTTNACHGFMSGIHLVDTLIGAGQIKYGLVVGGEQCSTITGFTIPKMQSATTLEEFQRYIGGLTLGDSGTAMVLGPKKEPELGFQGMRVCSNGEHFDLCTYETNQEEGYMDMSGIIREVIKIHTEHYAESMAFLGWSTEEIDYYLTHQPGAKLFDLLSEYHGVPFSKMPNVVHQYGNLASGTIPFTLGKMLEKDQLSRGDKVFIAVAGSGVTLSHTALVWP